MNVRVVALLWGRPWKGILGLQGMPFESLEVRRLVPRKWVLTLEVVDSK